ncbi:hypothetical protein BJX76DRAFT_362125 [Aspergillus varians]
MSTPPKDEKAPPPPPPPPENPASKIPPIVLKLKSAPVGHCFQPEKPTDPFPAPTGPYFFYGTLSDPAMLRDILRLETEPVLRPASLTGYECKLWGQYPALLDAKGSVVHGFVYRVQAEEHGGRLAGYETDNYRAEPCQIQYTDGNQPREDSGFVFKFVGNTKDLSEGAFDLGVWLGRMGRR